MGSIPISHSRSIPVPGPGPVEWEQAIRNDQHQEIFNQIGRHSVLKHHFVSQPQLLVTTQVCGMAQQLQSTKLQIYACGIAMTPQFLISGGDSWWVLELGWTSLNMWANVSEPLCLHFLISGFLSQCDTSFTAYRVFRSASRSRWTAAYFNTGT